VSEPRVSIEKEPKEMRLVVDVRARLDWLHPPKNERERILREVANNEAAKVAHDLHAVVQLLVAMMLERR
jgi:hypothetical protein